MNSMLNKSANGESPSVLWLAAVGLLMAILFVVWCLSTGHPIIFSGS
jgi:hypothetical protein